MYVVVVIIIIIIIIIIIKSLLFTVQCTSRSTVGNVRHIESNGKNCLTFSNVEFKVSVKIAETKQQPVAVA